jgi:hypothetical protein
MINRSSITNCDSYLSLFIPFSGRGATTRGNGVDEVGLPCWVASACSWPGLCTFPLLSTVVAIVGIAAMIHGVVAGVMVEVSGLGGQSR